MVSHRVYLDSKNILLTSTNIASPVMSWESDWGAVCLTSVYFYMTSLLSRILFSFLRGSLSFSSAVIFLSNQYHHPQDKKKIFFNSNCLFQFWRVKHFKHLKIICPLATGILSGIPFLSSVVVDGPDQEWGLVSGHHRLLVPWIEWLICF